MKKTLVTILSFIGVLLLTLGFSPTKCDAADNSIQRIDMDVYLDASGTANVTETWYASVYQGTEGYRPYGNLYESEITDFSVTDDRGIRYETQDGWNTDDSFEEKKEKCGILESSDHLELCWGISSYGERTYTLTYKITNIINQYTDAQGLYFSFLPEQMDQSPESATVFIHTDQSLDASNSSIWAFGCPNGTITFQNGGILMDSQGPLPSAHYMTALVRFPDQTFYSAIDQNKSFDEVYEEAVADADSPMTVHRYDYLLLAIPVILLIGAFVIWYLWGRDDKTIDVIEFYPPDDLNSAEIALLYQGKVSSEDLTSMIVYLASKGYLSIDDRTEEAAFGLIKSHDFVLKKVKDYDGDNSIEKRFFDGLFAGRDIVSKDMLTNKFYRVLNDIAEDMNSKDNQKIIFESTSLSKKIPMTIMISVSLLVGLIRALYAAEGDITAAIFTSLFPLIAVLVASQVSFRKKNIANNIFLIFWSLCFGGGALAAPIFSLAGTAPFFLGMIGLSLACSMGMIILRFFVPKRTPYGQEMLGRIRGFKHFLEIADKDKLETLVSENPSYFYDILPYTYVLDVSDKWIENFEDIAIEPAHWYHGHGVVGVRSFGTSLNSTLSSARSAMTSSPSSGSGGHGFSGGGGGAGGHSSGGGFR